MLKELRFYMDKFIGEALVRYNKLNIDLSQLKNEHSIFRLSYKPGYRSEVSL